MLLEAWGPFSVLMSGWEQQIFILLQSWRPEVSLSWNEDVGRAMLLQEALGETLFLDSSGFWWLPSFLGSWSHSSNLCLSDSIVFSSSVCSQPSSAFLLQRYLRLYLGPTWVVQDTISLKILKLITSAESLPYKVIHTLSDTFEMEHRSTYYTWLGGKGLSTARTMRERLYNDKNDKVLWKELWYTPVSVWLLSIVPVTC